MLDKSLWNGKTVFLTGHTGFKGCWLTIWLHSLGAKVIGYSLKPEERSMFKSLDIEQLCQSYFEDVRHSNKLHDCMHTSMPDIIIHFAAQPLVSLGYLDPVSTWETNVLGTVNFLEAARMLEGNIPILVISSDKCYENNEFGRPFKITDRLGGKDPYSASKAGTELVVNSYRESFFSSRTKAKLASARAGNVIGGGDFSQDRLVVDAVSSFVASKSVNIRQPDSIRPWQHVLEPIWGYMLLLQKMLDDDDFSSPWNFGPNLDGILSVKGLTEILINEWGDEANYTVNLSEGIGNEAKLLYLDSDKTKEKLGWDCKLDIKKSVSWTVEWYKRFYSNSEDAKSLLAFTQSQISKYTEI